MHVRTRSVSVCILTFVAIGFGCKQRTTRQSMLQDAAQQASFQVTEDEIAALPSSILGPATPVGKVPGLVIGVTLASSTEVNETASTALENRVGKRFMQQMIQRGPLFFAAVAVNPQNVGLAKKFFVSGKIKSVANSNKEKMYADMTNYPELKRQVNSGIAEQHLQAIHDAKREFHTTFQLKVPEEAPEAAPLSVAVVSKTGQVYGPYKVTGQAGDQMDLVFQMLEKLLNEET